MELRECGLRCEPRGMAARKGLPRSVACDPSLATDRHGSAALMWAAGGGHLDCCGLLLEPVQQGWAHRLPLGGTRRPAGGMPSAAGGWLRPVGMHARQQPRAPLGHVLRGAHSS
mmetsp:Transcript_12812/g.32325  ORF Transcript_12812/g.32325 Transcript_12812/m.32325 type:complete len:114 (+) Transcript_12812:124-465(+)